MIDREALRKLCDEATAGEWTVRESAKGIDRDFGIVADGGVIAEAFEHGGSRYEVCVEAEANADFIAAAREAVPDLLDTLEAVEWADEDLGEPCCFGCGAHKSAGHNSSCLLDAILEGGER